MFQRGMGIFDIANDPTCGLLQFGVFNPRCWAENADGPILPGPSVNTADSSFTQPPAPIPPVVQPDLTGQTVDIDKQIADTAAANRAQTAAFFAAQQAASKAAGPQPPAPISTTTILLIAAAGVAVLALAKR